MMMTRSLISTFFSLVIYFFPLRICNERMRWICLLAAPDQTSDENAFCHEIMRLEWIAIFTHSRMLDGIRNLWSFSDERGGVDDFAEDGYTQISETCCLVSKMYLPGRFHNETAS